jgi:hypothetical protein
MNKLAKCLSTQMKVKRSIIINNKSPMKFLKL